MFLLRLLFRLAALFFHREQEHTFLPLWISQIGRNAAKN